MAGAFGYEKAHYDLSMKIGELRLFEAVREKAPGSFTLSAAGFSCRHHLNMGRVCNRSIRLKCYVKQ